MGCFYRIVKYYLFLTNLLFTLVGLGLIGIGIWLRLYINNLIPKEAEGQREIFHIAAYFVIALGCIIFLISFCGCCGSIDEVRWLLIMYICFMLLLGLTKIVVAIIMLYNRNDWRSNTEDFINDAFTEPEYNNTFHALEAYLECCGTSGPDSYINETSSYLPPTCCPNSLQLISDIDVDDPSSIDDYLCNLDDAFTKGCSTTLGIFVANIITGVANGLIWIGAIELFDMLVAIYICYKVTKKMRKAKKQTLSSSNHHYGNMASAPPQAVFPASTITVTPYMMR